MGKLNKHLGELFGKATAVSRNKHISEAERLRRLLQAKNPYSNMLLRDYLDWARLVAEHNGVNFSEISAEELLNGEA